MGGDALPEEPDTGGAIRFISDVPLELPGWAREAVLRHPWVPLRDLVVERCGSAVFPTRWSDQTFLDSLAASVDENVQALQGVLAGTLTIDNVSLTNRLRFTALEAEARVTQAAMQRSYRLSYFLQWQEWSTVVAAAGLEAGVDAAAAASAQQSVAAIVHAYSDAVMSSVSLNFARSEEALNRSRTHVRQRLVRELLDGNADSLSPADLAILDYSLDAWHLAVQLTNVLVGAASQFALRLRATIHPMCSLVYPVRLDASVIWLGSRTPWTSPRIQHVVTVLEAAGLTAAVSGTAAGLAGFLRVFDQAQQVEGTRPADPDVGLRPVLRYADLRLEILLLRDAALAAEFLAQELGPLADDTLDAAKLRATVEASLRFGSHVATAQHLQLHEHTVRNRLRRAQELLGPLQERQTEIQVALRLWRLLRKR